MTAHRPEFSRLNLKTDHEEKKNHTEFGELENRFGIADELQALWTYENSGDQIAEYRAESKALEKRHEDHGRSDENQGLFR